LLTAGARRFEFSCRFHKNQFWEPTPDYYRQLATGY